jgi:hypothetical protein
MNRMIEAEHLALPRGTPNLPSTLSPSRCGSTDGGRTTGRLAGLVSHEMMITRRFVARLGERTCYCVSKNYLNLQYLFALQAESVLYRSLINLPFFDRLHVSEGIPNRHLTRSLNGTTSISTTKPADMGTCSLSIQGDTVNWNRVSQ